MPRLEIARRCRRRRGTGAAAVLAAVLAALAVSTAAAQPQTKDQQRCTNAMNTSLLRTTGAIGKAVVDCLREGAGPGATLEACTVADPKGKLAKARDRATADFDKRCTGTSRKPPNLPKLPPYGVSDAATVNAAAAGAYDVFHDVFGIDLDAGAIRPEDDASAAACQQIVAKQLRVCQAAKLREVAACAKRGLADKEAPFDSAADLASCFGSDPKGKVAKRCDLRVEPRPGKLQVDALRKKLAKKCTAKGVDLARAFPGCASTDAEATHACLERAVDCRSCLAIESAAGLGLDCDALDDGAANGSCAPTLGGHDCAIDPESGFLFESSAGFLLGTLAGHLRVDCGSPSGATGEAPCRCALADVDPVEVPAVGWTCITPVGGCPSGGAACSGGLSRDFVLSADHDVGVCSGNDACASTCEAHCAGTGAAVWDSGCEGFCEGGAADGAACTSDAGCPGGRCNGVAGGGHGNLCQCQCIDLAGEPSSPGGLRCDVGARIRIEASLPCDGADVVLDLGDRCLPVTTEWAQATLIDQDAVPGRRLPNGVDLNGGQSVACETLREAGAAGMFLVSAVNAFDVPGAGDVYLLLALGCL